MNYFRHNQKAQLIFLGAPKMIRYFSLPRILLKHIRPSKIAELFFLITQFSLNFSEVWQRFYLWLITFPMTHSTVFTHFGQNTVHNSIHHQSKKFLKCLKICTMVKGSVVQIVTHSFVPLILIYSLGVLQRLLGIFWWLSKGTGRNAHAIKQTLPVCQGIFSPPALLIHPGLCWPLQDTHISGLPSLCLSSLWIIIDDKLTMRSQLDQQAQL